MRKHHRIYQTERKICRKRLKGNLILFLNPFDFLKMEDIESARKSFDEFLQQEKDPKKIKYHEVWFLFFSFRFGKMDGAIEDLRALVPKAEDDDERFHIISRISDCLRLGGQKKQLIETMETIRRVV